MQLENWLASPWPSRPRRGNSLRPRCDESQDREIRRGAREPSPSPRGRGPGWGRGEGEGSDRTSTRLPDSEAHRRQKGPKIVLASPSATPILSPRLNAAMCGRSFEAEKRKLTNNLAINSEFVSGSTSVANCNVWSVRQWSLRWAVRPPTRLPVMKTE